MDDNLAGIQGTELDPHTSQEFEFESPPSSVKTPDWIQSNRLENSLFNDPLTFYSYPSLHWPIKLSTIKECLGITRSDHYLPDSMPSWTASSSSRSSPNRPTSPTRTVCFLNQPQLTSEQEVLSRQHQTALIDAHWHRKQFQLRTSLPPDSARSLDSITSNLPLPQLSFGSTTLIAGAAEVYISKEAYRNRLVTSTPHPCTVMLTTASTSQIVHFQAGLEHNYDQSPMACLKAEFLEEQEQSNSIHTHATALASKKTLLSSDVVDQGSDRPRDTPCFHLTADLNLDLHRMSNELQFFLQWIAGLIPGCLSYFVVDPRDTFLTILNGAYDISQLHAAWVAISKWMELGIKYINKYELEYKEADEEKRIKSPISTNPDVIQNTIQILSTDQRMWYMYSQVLHHQAELMEDALQWFNELQQWWDIYPAPEALMCTVKSALSSTPVPEFPCTSYKGNGQFILPPVQPPQAPSNVNKGKNREFHWPPGFSEKPGSRHSTTR